MKKFIVLALFGLLIVASTVSAQKLEFKASGMIDFDSTLEHECSFLFRWGRLLPMRGTMGFSTHGSPLPSILVENPTGSLDHTASYTYGRGVLKFDAVMSQEVERYMMFEIDAFR